MNVARCQTCGHPNKRTGRFCTECGNPLTPPNNVQSSSDRTLAALSAVGGERKWITVLFADVRNSTQLVADLDPEEGLKLLRPALEAMKEAVHRYDGVVNKVQGDGIMALFGAPKPHEDHATRGCLAAVAMQEAVSGLGDVRLKIRVGLHTGEVVVHRGEDSLRSFYDAAGVTVHLASRMEQLSTEGCILVTAETLAGAKQFVDALPRGYQDIRGFKAPVEVFEITGLRNAPASEAFRNRSHLTAFTGRSEHLDILENEFAEAAKGGGRVVGIVGDAGVGKSRLCFEFAERCRQAGARVLEARVLAHGRATPFQPLLDLLRDFFEVTSQMTAETSARRVVDQLNRLSLSEDAIPLMLDFLGIKTAKTGTHKLDPKVRKIRLLEIVRSIAQSSSKGSPTVLIIEDVHWIDTASEEFIEAFADAVVGTRTLLVINFRPGFAAPWMQRSYYRQINLAPLSPTQSYALLEGLLGTDRRLQGLGTNIVERAEGNPFFLEELITSLIQEGRIEGRPGSYRPTKEFSSARLPSTIQAVIAARIDQLEDSAKEVLLTAAVIGREVDFDILERITRLPAGELTEAAWRLRRAEMIYDLPSFARSSSHAFRHPLVQEVAYASILHERRRDLHARIAAVMESIYRDSHEERASVIAYHFEEAGETFKAAQYNMHAAIWVGANDPKQALQIWRKVHALLAGFRDEPTAKYVRMMACGQIINFGWREGMVAADAAAYFEEARELALALGDLRASALIHAAYGRILAASGSADEYVSKIEEANAIAGKSLDASLQVTVKAVLCHALRLSGRMADALAINSDAIERASQIGKFDSQMLGFDVEIWLTAMRGQTLITMGRAQEAKTYLDRVLQTEGQIDPVHAMLPSLAYVDLAWASSDVGLARRHAERALRLAEKSGIPYLVVYAKACHGASYMIDRQLDLALTELTDALQFARDRRAGLEYEARILADLANVSLLSGDLSRALVRAKEAVSVATARRARVWECLARLTYAEILWAEKANDWRADALAQLELAERLANETSALIYAPSIARIKAASGFASGGLPVTA